MTEWNLIHSVVDRKKIVLFIVSIIYIYYYLNLLATIFTVLVFPKLNHCLSYNLQPILNH